MPHHFRAVIDAPHAENGTTERTFETDDANEVVNQVVSVATDNPGKEFTVRITATEIQGA
jgi:hypothetical protein